MFASPTFLYSYYRQLCNKLFPANIASVVNSFPPDHETMVVAEGRRHFSPVRGRHIFFYPQYITFFRYVKIQHPVIEVKVAVLWDQVCFLLSPMRCLESSLK